jgi:hypothetical protein
MFSRTIGSWRAPARIRGLSAFMFSRTGTGFAGRPRRLLHFSKAQPQAKASAPNDLHHRRGRRGHRHRIRAQPRGAPYASLKTTRICACSAANCGAPKSEPAFRSPALTQEL